MNDRNGFSLIEILVVISIIGVLSTLSMVALNFAKEQARQTVALHDLDVLKDAVKLLENDTGEWPGHQLIDEITTGGSNEIWNLAAAVAGLADTDGSFVSWSGPYIVDVPIDPWGNNYFWDSDYTIDGVNHVVIGSFGPNGVGPNLYDSDDIIRVIR